MTLGQKLRSARQMRRMTQKQLGAGTMSASFISMLEHDRVRPSLATLSILAERLEQPLSYFLDTVPLAAEQAEVVLRRGEALLRQHRFTEALEAFTAAAGPAGESHDLPLIIRWELGLGQALAGIRQLDLAEQHLHRARELAETAGHLELIGAAANALGFLAFRARRYARAREIFQEGIDRLRDGGIEDGEVIGKLLTNLGRVYVELGLPAQAQQCYRQSAQVLRRAADPSHLALLYFNMGLASERQRSFAQARAYLEQAADLFALHENLHLLSVVKRSLGVLYLEQGALPDALAMLEQSLHLAQQVGDDEGVAQTLVEVARLRAKQGQGALARDAAEQAAALARRINDEAEAVRAQAALAGAAAAEVRLPEAVAGYEAAIAAFERLGMRGDLARACRDLGFVLMAVGRQADAAHHFARVFELQAEPAIPSTREAP